MNPFMDASRLSSNGTFGVHLADALLVATQTCNRVQTRRREHGDAEGVYSARDVFTLRRDDVLQLLEPDGEHFMSGNEPKLQQNLLSRRPGRGRFCSPSAPMDTSFTPLLAMKSSALLTLEILWTRILPRSGLARRSPENKNETLQPRTETVRSFQVRVNVGGSSECPETTNVWGQIGISFRGRKTRLEM